MSPRGLLFEASEAEGVRVFSFTVRMVIKVDAGISNFGFLVAIRIETEANSTLEIRSFGFDDELIVEVPYCS